MTDAGTAALVIAALATIVVLAWVLIATWRRVAVAVEDARAALAALEPAREELATRQAVLAREQARLGARVDALRLERRRGEDR